MVVFKAAATEQLRLLGLVFLLGNAPFFRAPTPDPGNACETELYARVGRTQCYLLGAVFAAGMLLFTVKMKVSIAEAGADATAKATKGIASVAAGWQRAALRGMFLVAVGLSAAASFLAVNAFEDGTRYRYRTGCGADRMGSRSAMAVVLMAVMALAHCPMAWVAAVSPN